MRGATSHDGKLSGNRQTVEAYDRDKGKQAPKAGGGHSGGAHEPSGHDEIKSVVGEHGHAYTHTIRKHEDGGYSSSTEHEDGYTHETDHASLEEAHEHGREALGESDHAPLNDDSHSRAERRSLHEKHRSGSGDSGVDFLPGE